MKKSYGKKFVNNVRKYKLATMQFHYYKYKY